jgi:hypothetical protein
VIILARLATGGISHDSADYASKKAAGCCAKWYGCDFFWRQRLRTKLTSNERTPAANFRTDLGTDGSTGKRAYPATGNSRGFSRLIFRLPIRVRVQSSGI